MKNLFPGYCSLSSDEIREIWDNCIFVFDTNVLLDLYRLSDDSSKNLLEIIKVLCEKNRLWIPYQVAKEYTINLHKTIYDQSKNCDEIIREIQKIKDNILTKAGHPHLDQEELTIFSENFDTLLEIFRKKKEYLFNLLHENNINSELMSYFIGHVGNKYSKEHLNQVVKDGEERIKDRIPPGYKDKNKDENKCGDYIIWCDIIEYSKGNDKDVIFVTKDVKEDWFLIVRGETIGPRPELVNEFFELTNKHRFHIVKLDSFMNQVQNMGFDIEIKETTVKEIIQQQEKVICEQTESFSHDVKCEVVLESVNSESVSDSVNNN